MDIQKISLENLKVKLMGGKLLNREESDFLINEPLEKLCKTANEIREYFCQNYFDLCSVFNGKCGKCSEDCKFCAQSVFYKTGITEFPMEENAETLIKEATYNKSKGILRFSVVTSGRGLSDKETALACANYIAIANSCSISLCASHGLLTVKQLKALKAAGVKRIHCNLETSRDYFPNICTTHSYDDRIKTIITAQEEGFEVCSGGIFGMGESWKDRINMAFDLRELGIRSVPINILRAIKGTPFENKELLSLDEIRRIVAIFRFVLPDAAIRMAAGRGQMLDKGRSVFLSGANACITGDMLTVAGIHVDEDMKNLNKLGFEVKI